MITKQQKDSILLTLDDLRRRIYLMTEAPEQCGRLYTCTAVGHTSSSDRQVLARDSVEAAKKYVNAIMFVMPEMIVVVGKEEDPEYYFYKDKNIYSWNKEAL